MRKMLAYSIFIISIFFLFCDKSYSAVSLISQGKSVSVSSTYAPDGDTKGNLTDGNQWTSWNSGTFGPSWAMIDLGANYQISKIIWYATVTPACTQTFQLYIGTTSSNLTLVSQKNAYISPAASNIPVTFDIAATTGRYVKINVLQSPSWICAWEFEVYTPSYTIGATAGTGGTVSPASRVVAHGNTTTFTVTPATGYTRGSVSGDGSGGTWNGNTYTTAQATQDRSLTFSFVLNTYTIGATAGTGGTVSPASQSVSHGSTTTFTVTPATGYTRGSVSGDASGGTWNGNTYTTAQATQNRSLTFSFVLNTYTIGATAGTGGTVSPASQSVSHGSTTTFTVTPATGYTRGSVSGDGSGGTWNGNTYTTAQATQNRSLTFSFVLNTYTIGATAGTGGTVSPASQSVSHGSTTTFTVTPATGYTRGSVSGDGSGGTWNGNTYTTAQATQNRSLTFSFVLNTYTIGATAGTGGTVSPASQSVSHGSTTTFTVTPATGYTRGSVSGDASGGTWNGNTYTTAQATQDRSLTFSFTDALAPELLSFTINDEAQYTTSQTVTLNISAYDSAGGTITMQLRNENQTWDEVSEFEAYATEKANYSLSAGYGLKTVYIRLKDDTGNTSGEYSAQILVVTPPIANAGTDITATEGDTVTLNGTATDSDPGDTLSYAWDTDGDGQFDDLSGSNPQIHYADNTEFDAVLQVTDSYGLISTDTVHITINNAQPSLADIANKLVVVGTEFDVENITFSDLGVNDTLALRIDWNDGTVTDIAGAVSPLSLTHMYSTSGIYAVEVKVTDKDGTSVTKTFSVNASYVPEANAGGNSNGAYVAYESETIHFSASASTDLDSGDTLSYKWCLDNDGLFDDSSTISFDKQYTEDYTGVVAVQVTDSKGFTDTAYTTVTILNREPQIPSISDFEVREGDTVSLSNIEITDPGTEDSHTVNIVWGDSAEDNIGSVPSRKFTASHMYTNVGVYNAQVTVTDDDGGVTMRQFSVKVGLQEINLSASIMDNRSIELTFNAVAGKSYYILYCDNDSVMSLNSKRLWKTAALVQSGAFVDSGDADGYDNIAGTSDDRCHPAQAIQRYYCVVQAQEVGVGQWLSSGIVYARNIVLYVGRNFIGKCGNEDTLNKTLDSRFLPAAGLMSLSTSVTFYQVTGNKDAYIFYEQGYPRAWFDAAGVNMMDSESVSDGCGLIVTIPPGQLSVLSAKCGNVNEKDSVEIDIAHNDYTVVAWPYDKEVTITQSGLVESGILQGSTSRKADLVYFFNSQTQRYDQSVFFCNASGVMKWKYLNMADCNRIIKPGEAFLIKTLSSSQFSKWHVARPYASVRILHED